MGKKTVKPRAPMTLTFTSPAQVIRDEIAYWKSRSAEERFAAVERIRDETIAISGQRAGAGRMERVYIVTDAPTREVHRDRRPRARRARPPKKHG